MTDSSQTSENKIKFAQDVMRPYSGGRAMGGFNSRIHGNMDGNQFHINRDFEGGAGWDLANKMIKDGKLFYWENFHTKGRCHAFVYGGTWACNGCNRDHLEKDWWKVKVFKGNGKTWWCIGEGFEDLMISKNYGEGDTRELAIENYRETMGRISNHD